MTDVTRQCIADICRRIDYWIAEGEMTHEEIDFVLREVDAWYMPEDEEEDEIECEFEDDD